MTVFDVHTLKEVSRGQMQSAGRYLTMKGVNKRKLNTAQKQQLILPLAKAFLSDGYVSIMDGADFDNLHRNQVSKVKHF